MVKRLLLGVLISLTQASFTVVPAFSQSPGPVVGDDLNALVNGRSWAISYYGDPTTPAMRMVWDFRRNGSLCARPVGGKQGDKCMDEGKWSVKAEMVCWELTWMGRQGGYQSACFSVKQVTNDQFELTNLKPPETKFAVFKVL